MDVNVESYDQAQADAMETGCSESAMEKVPKPEMGNSLDLLPSSKHLYKSRCMSCDCYIVMLFCMGNSCCHFDLCDDIKLVHRCAVCV